MLVAFSGGADSTALLHALASAGVAVVAAHLDHGMREEAGKEARQCGELARSLGCQFVSAHRSVPSLASERRIGLEEAGRLARIEFLASQRLALGLDWIVTAHTLDDQIETLLMRLARGTGLRGMGGIAPVAGRYLRPYLAVRRAATHEYCKKHGLPYLSDPSNTDPRFARSRIRAAVVPVLCDLYPGAREAAGRFAEAAREDEALLEAEANKELAACREPDGPLEPIVGRYETRIRRGDWASLPGPLQFRVLRAASAPLRLSRAAAEAVEGCSGSVMLEGGRIVWNRARIRVERHCPGFDPMPLSGSVAASGPGWRAWIGGEPGVLTAWVREGSVTRVEPVRPGSRVSPVGMEGSKKVSKALADAKIGPAARPHVPVFAGPDGPVWIPGVALSRYEARSEHAIGAVRLNLGYGP